MSGGIFDSIKLLIMIGAYFAAFQLGKMAERPKSQWPAAKAGQNPWMVGDWATYQKVFMGVVAVAILMTLLGPGGFGSMGMGRGGYGGGGFY
ncbi:hypothetical protein ATCVCanal1_341L [Acanthocystis turfacea Chlorella virus Canal-1]|nr:hypothetical protein ATCVCanal1_341L [Acanthocystis turfacea Chlorella virus Canal-1]